MIVCKFLPIDAIKWNAKQSCTEFKELFDDANSSLLMKYLLLKQLSKNIV